MRITSSEQLQDMHKQKEAEQTAFLLFITTSAQAREAQRDFDSVPMQLSGDIVVSWSDKIVRAVLTAKTLKLPNGLSIEEDKEQLDYIKEQLKGLQMTVLWENSNENCVFLRGMKDICPNTKVRVAPKARYIADKN